MTFRKQNNPATSRLQGTPEQLAIWDAVAHKPENLILDAKAGTGKTTTCIHSMQLINTVSRLTRRRVGFCAFTASVGAELKRKVPPGMTGGTLHSFMFAVLRDNVPGLTVQLDKVRKFTDTLFPDRRWRRGERWTLIKLVGLCRNLGITATTVQDPTAMEQFVEAINAQHSLWNFFEGSGQYPKLASRILEACADLKELAVYGIDYDDMLWLPYYHQMEPNSKFNLLFVDECQDINAVQQANALALSDRVIAVGDRNQAIFGFRGADIRSIDTLKNLLQNRPARVDELPLTVCWRCPLSGIELAQKLVPAIQPAPNALPGTVSTIEPSAVIRLAQPGDMVLCRTNAPLIRSVYAFWTERRPAYIRGREEDAARLRSLADQIINRISPSGQTATSMTAFHRGLADREESDIRILQQVPNNEYRIADLRDRFACLRIVAENTGSLEQFQSDLQSLFAESNPLTHVCHSSIHRAKGLEADNVFILEPHLLPHPRATQPWEREQERNIAYVAVTRFKRNLYWAGEMPDMFSQYFKS